MLLYDTFANVISAANIPCQESLSSDLLVQEEQERKLESIWSNNPITTEFVAASIILKVVPI